MGRLASVGLRKAPLLLFALLISAMLLLSACSEPPAQVGGFSIGFSPDYVVRESNPLSDVEIDGQSGFAKCDSTVTSSESAASISASWYDGVSYQQAMDHQTGSLAGSENAPEQETLTRLPSLDSGWVESERRIVEANETVLNTGSPVFICEYAIGDELGNPHSAICRKAIFSTGEDAIGVIEYIAYDDGQAADMRELFDKVLANIA